MHMNGHMYKQIILQLVSPQQKTPFWEAFMTAYVLK
jgi:hypothetical protein